MHHRTWRPSAALLLAALLVAASAAPATAQQTRLTTPQQHFGHEIGADYQLPNYTKLHQYWIKLSNESDRMILDTIGLTAEGRPQIMAIVTSPDNHRNLARYKEIATRLALAEGLTDEEARRLAQEGKAVVWMDGGLHATEVLGAQQLTETLWQMVSGTDPETMRFLNDVIMLFVHANPDGHELVADWYMRNPNPQQRSTGGIPRLYQKYVGHDNNRDFYLSSQNESTNMNRVLYREWYPQIMYNHHQTGPRGTVLFAPPFRDPFNYNYDPLIVVGLDLVGASMHNRFIAENKPGATMRRGAGYSTWWNGGLRTTAYFHNIIGLLTETIGNPTPMEIPFVLDRQLPSGDYPYPIKPQPWHFRQSIDYSVTANKAVLDVASRHREQFLYNIYQMGRNSIQRGSQDTWTMWPNRIAKAEAATSGARGGQGGGGGGGGGFGGGQGNAQAAQRAQQILYAPALRDPRGYILSADQPDFPTATKFIETLMKNGVVVHRATRAFAVGGKQYPAGSYVVQTAQAFRPHILDMFEPQDHPNDFQYPGGPPIPPYDNAGYTLAYQMGVQFDRVLEGFEGPFEEITTELPSVVPGRVNASGNVAGYYLSHAPNDAFVAINRLLKNREDVYWLRAPVTVSGRTYPVGTLWIASKSSTRPLLEALAREKGLHFDGAAAKPSVDAMKLNPIRIALWDRYGGSMPSGWTRYLLEQFEFPFEVVYPQQLDAGNLKAKYDVIIFPDGAIPALRAGGGGQGFGGGGGGGGGQQNIPAEFQNRLGNVTAERTIPQLRQFLEAGGTIMAIGSSTNIAEHLGLPVSDQLVERQQDGTMRELPREKYYIPGSVLHVAVDRSHPLAHGMPDSAMVFFDNSPVFRMNPDAAQKGLRRIAWYASDTPLRSGWAWGQSFLENGIAVAEADVGRGKVFLYGPEVLFRAQPHGTFKLVFNGMYYPSATAGRP